MARRKARKLPPIEAQKAAAQLHPQPHNKSRHIRTCADGTPSQVDLLFWFLTRFEKAAPHAPPPKNRATDWKMHQEAVSWLRSKEFTKISDAPGSRCVRSLQRFLTDWRAQQAQIKDMPPPPQPASEYTAAELAGTLIATAKAITDGFKPDP